MDDLSQHVQVTVNMTRLPVSVRLLALLNCCRCRQYWWMEWRSSFPALRRRASTISSPSIPPVFDTRRADFETSETSRDRSHLPNACDGQHPERAVETSTDPSLLPWLGWRSHLETILEYFPIEVRCPILRGTERSPLNSRRSPHRSPTYCKRKSDALVTRFMEWTYSTVLLYPRAWRHWSCETSGGR